MAAMAKENQLEMLEAGYVGENDTTIQPDQHDSESGIATGYLLGKMV